MYSRLRRLRFLLSVHIWNQRDVDQGEVLVSDAELELSNGFDKGRGFDITDGTSELSCLSRA